MSEATAVGRLPRGRHRLSRDHVVRSQRERMLRAMADTMVDRGYVGTSVAEVIRRAGVSRETFYQQFSSKQDCFVATYDAAVAVLLHRTDDPARQPAAGRAPIEQFSHLLGRYLDALVGEPAFARVFLIEVYAAGPAAVARRARAQALFAEALIDIFGASAPSDRFACETLVAAISSMVTTKLAASDLDGLRALQLPIVELVARAIRMPGVCEDQ